MYGPDLIPFFLVSLLGVLLGWCKQTTTASSYVVVWVEKPSKLGFTIRTSRKGTGETEINCVRGNLKSWTLECISGAGTYTLVLRQHSSSSHWYKTDLFCPKNQLFVDFVAVCLHFGKKFSCLFTF